MRMLVLVMALTVTGCSTMGSDGMLQAMQNLEHCDRQYTVALGMGAAGSLTINCQARPFEAQ